MMVRLTSMEAKYLKTYPGMESVMEMMEEVNGAQAEHNEELEQVDRKLETLEELKQQVQQNGADKTLATTINSLDGKERLALEHFTSFPSQCGVNVALEEIDEKYKKIALGVGIGVIVAIVLKIIHSIWKWFKKRGGTENKEEMEKKGEKAAQAAENHEKAKEELANLERQLLQQIEKEKALEVEAEKKEGKTPHLEALEKIYTRLIHRILADKNFLDITARVFNNSGELMNSSLKALETIEEINSSIEGRAENNDIEPLIKMIEGAYHNFPVESMRNNLAFIKEKYGEIKEDASQLNKFNPEDIPEIIDMIKSGKDGKFLQHLLKHHPSQTALFRTTNFEDRNEMVLKSLKESDSRFAELVKAGKMTSEQAKKIKDFISYYKENILSTTQFISYYQTLAGNWDRFVVGVVRYMQAEEWMIKKAASKVKEFFKGKNEADKVAQLEAFLRKLEEKR